MAYLTGKSRHTSHFSNSHNKGLKAAALLHYRSWPCFSPSWCYSHSLKMNFPPCGQETRPMATLVCSFHSVTPGGRQFLEDSNWPLLNHVWSCVPGRFIRASGERDAHGPNWVRASPADRHNSMEDTSDNTKWRKISPSKEENLNHMFTTCYSFS